MKARVLEMPNLLRLTLGVAIATVLSSCATQSPTRSTSASPSGRLQKVRTTAYTHTERGGHKNALGTYLSGRLVKSAASDWSRFPLGTRFRIVETGEEYMIDDYGSALVGTNTIDLYKTSRAAMRKWGVRHVNIEILQWGSDAQSLKVLGPRKRHAKVRRMIVALQKKNGSNVAAGSF